MVDPKVILGVTSAGSVHEPGDFNGSELETYRPLIVWFEDRITAAIEKVAERIEQHERQIEAAEAQIAAAKKEWREQFWGTKYEDPD